MPEHGVERLAHQFAPVLHIKIRVVVLYIREALEPAGHLHAAHLAVLHLGDDRRSLVGVRGRWG